MNTNFIKTFDSISTEIPFNPAWENGTGYFDYAVEGENMPVIPTGLTVKCTDNEGRKMIITSITGQACDGGMNGKQVSNVVIFERYAPSANRSKIVASASGAMREKYEFLRCGSIDNEMFSEFHAR